MTYDCIFVNSTPMFEIKVRGLGAHRLAHELRSHGYSVLVIDFIDYFTFDQYKEVISKAVGDNTIFAAYSSTWFNLSTDEVIDGTGDHINERYKLLSDSKDQLHKFVGRGIFPELCNVVKEQNPNTKIILGGSKAVLLEPEVRDFVDHCMFGYSESMIIDFVKDPDRWGYIIDHDTKAFNGSHGFDFATSRTSFEDNSFMTPYEVVSVELSRGCRFKCKFCSYPLIGRKDVASYIKSKESFRQELIENYERHGITKYAVVDDTFNDSTEKVRHFHEVMTSLPFDVHFWSYLRADVLASNPEQIPLLHEMGLNGVWFGIETFTHEAGKAIGKGMDPERIKDMLYQAKDVWKDDVYIQQGLIIGLPFESTKDIEKNSIDWLMRDDCPVDHVGVNALEIHPDSTLGNKYKFVYRSEFDTNHDKYGYYFPEGAHYWRKDDDTDINSYHEARELMAYYDDIMKTKARPKSCEIHISAIDYEPFSDYNKLKKMSAADRGKLVDAAPPRSYLFNKDIKTNYIEPLLNAL